MENYKIYFKKSALKELKTLPKKELQRILTKIEELKNEPRPASCRKLSGQEKYRIRQGNYRIIYSIEDHELIVWVVKVAHRREAYRF